MGISELPTIMTIHHQSYHLGGKPKPPSRLQPRAHLTFEPCCILGSMPLWVRVGYAGLPSPARVNVTRLVGWAIELLAI